MKTGRDFLFAIRETIPNERLNPGLDEEAIDVLDGLARRVFEGADSRSLRGRDRDAVIFWEGMLRGVQIQLLKKGREELKEAARQGRLDPDGNISDA